MNIVQHIPSFVDGVEPASGEFETLEELERVPFVARWKVPPGPPQPHTVRSWDKDGNATEREETLPAIPPLKRFSHSSHAYDRRDTLMAELADGSWWVIGFMDKGAGERLGLPRWEAPPR